MGIFKFVASFAGATAIKVYAGVDVVKLIMQHGYKLSSEGIERVKKIQSQNPVSTERKIGNCVVNFTPYVNIGASYADYVNLKSYIAEMLDDEESIKKRFSGALVKMTDEEVETMASLPSKTDKFLYWGSLMEQQPRKTAIEELYGDLFKGQAKPTDRDNGDIEDINLESISSMLSEIFGDSLKGKKKGITPFLETFMDEAMTDLFGSDQVQSQDGPSKPKVKKKDLGDSYSCHQNKEDK